MRVQKKDIYRFFKHGKLKKKKNYKIFIFLILEERQYKIVLIYNMYKLYYSYIYCYIVHFYYSNITQYNIIYALYFEKIK